MTWYLILFSILLPNVQFSPSSLKSFVYIFPFLLDFYFFLFFLFPCFSYFPIPFEHFLLLHYINYIFGPYSHIFFLTPQKQYDIYQAHLNYFLQECCFRRTRASQLRTMPDPDSSHDPCHPIWPLHGTQELQSPVHTGMWANGMQKAGPDPGLSHTPSHPSRPSCRTQELQPGLGQTQATPPLPPSQWWCPHSPIALRSKAPWTAVD